MELVAEYWFAALELAEYIIDTLVYAFLLICLWTFGLLPIYLLMLIPLNIRDRVLAKRRNGG